MTGKNKICECIYEVRFPPKSLERQGDLKELVTLLICGEPKHPEVSVVWQGLLLKRAGVEV